MKQLLLTTTAYRSVSSRAKSGELSHATLALFSDGEYLRALLKECAKGFFGADNSRVCELVESEQFSDCFFLPAEGAKLTVQDASFILEESALRPVEGEKKLFVLDRFHTASALVQNKLLKILEEPPKGVYFLLGATSEFGILPTVLSRVSKIEEPPFSEEQVLKALQREYGQSSELARAAAACGGCYSAAKALLGGGGEDFALAEQFLSGEGIALARKIGERKEKRAFLSALKLTLRDTLFLKLGQEKYCSLKGERLKALAREYPEGALVRGLELVVEAEKQINYNAVYGQCLLALAISIMEEKEKWQRLS